MTVTSDSYGPEVAQLSITVVDVPEAGWAQTWGGSGWEGGQELAVDSSDNILVAGTYEDTVDFDPGTGTDDHTAVGGADAFLCTYDSSGGFIWALTWGGSDADNAQAIAIDGMGDIYVAGYFGATVDFDPGSGTDEHMSVGDDDAYLSKFDSSGNLLWVRTWGGVANDHAEDIAIDSMGDVYVVGSFQDTADFDPDSDVYNLTPVGSYDVFVTKFDSTGDFQWARSWGGSMADDCTGVVVDSSDNVWTVGTFRDTVDFDPGAGTDDHTAVGNPDIFLSELDSSGAYVMANTWGGPGSAFARGVAINGAGAIFVAGYFSGTVDFHPGATTDDHISNGSHDAFLSRFDSSGSYNWTVTWGGVDYDDARQLAIDGTNAVYVTGAFRDTVDFDPSGAFENHTSVGSDDIYVTKLDSAGNHVWARSLGSAQSDAGYSVACDSNNNVYCTGDFRETIDFEPEAGTDDHTSNGDADAFLLKYLPNAGW